MKNQNRIKAILATALVLFLLIAPGCKKDNTTNNNNNNSAGNTYVQLINASPGTPHASVFHGNEDVLSDFYYEITTGYNQYSAQNLTLRVDVIQTILSTPVLNCDKNATYTFFLFDSFPSAKYVLVKDTVTTLPAGKSAVKFVNVSSNSGTISVRLQGGATVASNISYAGANAAKCSSSFILFDATSNPTFEAVDASSNVISSIASPNLVLEAGKSYTVFLCGYNGAAYPNDIKMLATYDEIVNF